MINAIEKQIRTGRNLHIIRLLLRFAAYFFAFVRCRPFADLVLEGRIFVEYRAGRHRAAEQLLLRYAKRNDLPLWAVTSYIARVVNPGHAKQLEQLMESPGLSKGVTAFLRSAALRQHGNFGEALTALGDPSLPSQMLAYAVKARRDIFHPLNAHEWLALDGLSFLDAEPNRINLELAVTVAMSAEAAGRNDLFAKAISRLLSDISKVSKDRCLAQKHLADFVMAKLIIFDIDGAVAFLRNSFVARIKKAKKILPEILELREEIKDYAHVIRSANKDIISRANRQQPIPQDAPIIILPAAGFRKSAIDYKGFRSDIRFIIGVIVKTLEENNIKYKVAGKIHNHVKINLSTPFFSYHTVSDGEFGLHFKETDRPSHFSFDTRGYAGWSSFSEIPASDYGVNEVSSTEANNFFGKEKARIIEGNISKYEQASINAFEKLPERFIFIPLQLTTDVVAQLAYVSPFEMMDEVIATAHVHGLAVVIKRHPRCSSPDVTSYLSQRLLKGEVQITSGSIHSIIPRSEAVCVINSSVGAEALLHEKPVYVFGRSDYMNACFICKTPGDFARQFSIGRIRLSSSELRKFWYIFRNQYAIDLADKERAAQRIQHAVLRHLNRTWSARGFNS